MDSFKNERMLRIHSILTKNERIYYSLRISKSNT